MEKAKPSFEITQAMISLDSSVNCLRVAEEHFLRNVPSYIRSLKRAEALGLLETENEIQDLVGGYITAIQEAIDKELRADS